MKRQWWILMVALLGACVSGRPIQLDPPDAAAREVVEASNSRWTRVHLADTVVLASRGLRLEGDDLVWTSAEGPRVVAALRDVTALEHRDRLGGLLEGALVGLAVAGVTGWIGAGIAEESGSSCGGCRGFTVAVFTGAVTIPLGAVLGALRGYRILYRAR